MAKVVGDIAVTVGADISPLRKGMDKAGRSVKGFGRDSEAMGKKFAKVGVGIAVAAIAASTAILKMASVIGKVGAEISNLAKIAGISTTEFQRLAAGAQTVGVEQDKLSDILKDVNDKIGDFMSTGAGPMADFFENVAPLVDITAESFRNLSGPQSLQLYVSSLEKAGASQQDMTFYLEALASDSTALLPLLRDNGFEMKRLGDAAESTGRVLSEKTVAAADKLNDKLREIRDTTRNKTITAMLALEDELILLAGFVQSYGVPALEALIKVGAKTAEVFEKVAGFLDKITGGQIAEFNAMIPPSVFDEPGYGDAPEDAPGDGPGPLKLGITKPAGLGRRADTKKGKGSSRDFEAEMQTLREQFATEFEIIESEFAKQLTKLDEFRAAKVSTEEEYNELEARIRQDHADKMVALERAEMQAKLAIASDVFGDLAKIMTSENKKLFKIGQVAAIAESTIKGYQAAVSAWEKGMKVGGPGVAAAFTAASLAKTGALISNIASQSSSGGGGTASVGGGTVATPAANTSPNVALQLVGGDMYGRDQVISLINAINEAQEDGAIVRLV